MQELIEKTKLIKLLILDIDGTLTNGCIYLGEDGNELKRFHVHDGLGIKLLLQAGITVAAISNRASRATYQRLQELGIAHIYLACGDKFAKYRELKQKLGLNNSQIACMGDDLPDLPLLQSAGLAITVPRAAELVKQHADYITKQKAGKGAVREACEFILQIQGKYQAVVQSFLLKTTEIDNEH